jgi:hypothetical protein
MLVQSLLRLLDRTWLEDRDLRGEVSGYSAGSFRVAYYGPRLLSIYDLTARRGMFWLDDADALPWYEPGAPFRVLFDWMVADPTTQLVHAGAISTPAGGVLLGGAGGSGKSTTALSCLVEAVGDQAASRGLRYVSDDYVIVENGDDLRAHGPYATAKVKGLADLERFPELAPWVSNIDEVRRLDGTDDAPKPMMFTNEMAPAHLDPSTSVAALVFPKYRALDACEIAPIDSSTAFKLLAPSTIQQVPASRSQAMRLMRAMAFRAPAYVLGLPRDRRLIPAAIEWIADDAIRSPRSAT